MVRPLVPDKAWLVDSLLTGLVLWAGIMSMLGVYWNSEKVNAGLNLGAI